MEVKGRDGIRTEEMVTRFALECIGGLISQGKQAVDVKLDAYWRYNDEVDRADRAEGLRTYLDPRAHNYYQNEFRRSSTNGLLDTRLLWHWLRHPATPSSDGRRPEIDESLVPVSQVISPYFGHDLIVD